MRDLLLVSYFAIAVNISLALFTWHISKLSALYFSILAVLMILAAYFIKRDTLGGLFVGTLISILAILFVVFMLYNPPNNFNMF